MELTNETLSLIINGLYTPTAAEVRQLCKEILNIRINNSPKSIPILDGTMLMCREA